MATIVDFLTGEAFEMDDAEYALLLAAEAEADERKAQADREEWEEARMAMRLGRAAKHKDDE